MVTEEYSVVSSLAAGIFMDNGGESYFEHICYDLIPSIMSLHGSLQNAPNLRKSNLNSSKLYN